MWGDVPYSQASDPSHFPTPQLDPQQQVYAAIQARLDTAIIDLQATGPTNFGAGANDLVYGGDAASWLALAHTLKARYYVHGGERGGARISGSARPGSQRYRVAQRRLPRVSHG